MVVVHLRFRCEDSRYYRSDSLTLPYLNTLALVTIYPLAATDNGRKDDFNLHLKIKKQSRHRMLQAHDHRAYTISH